MTLERTDQVGVVVDDLEAATGLFVELGLEPVGVEGARLERLAGLDGAQAEIATSPTPARDARVEPTERIGSSR